MSQASGHRCEFELGRAAASKNENSLSQIEWVFIDMWFLGIRQTLERMPRFFLKEVLLDTADPLLVLLHFPSLDFISHARVMREFEIGNPLERNLVGDVDQVSNAGICAWIVHGGAKTRGVSHTMAFPS